MRVRRIHPAAPLALSVLTAATGLAGCAATPTVTTEKDDDAAPGGTVAFEPGAGADCRVRTVPGGRLLEAGGLDLPRCPNRRSALLLGQSRSMATPTRKTD